MSPLFGRRRELKTRADREAAGEVFWTTDVPESTRFRLVHVMDEFSQDDGLGYFLARQSVMRDRGKMFLADRPGYESRQDFLTWFMTTDFDGFATALEAFASAIDSDDFRRNHYGTMMWGRRPTETFDAAVNGILREDRISLELVGNEAVALSSREMHAAVVVPALRLLSRPGWASVERAYQDALKQLSDGHGPNAITDAGTALQEALEAVGAKGKSLGPLINSARELGYLTSHDAPMADALKKIAEWVSADRSNSGDAHNSASASIDDAWLTVHVVGALIVRLSAEQRRPGR